MADDLTAFVARDLARDVPSQVRDVASTLAARLDGVAVLFYGSVLRTQALGDILDFYVLTGAPRGSVLRRLGVRYLWPDVSYHEIVVDGATIRAKVAAMPLDTFERAAGGGLIDTTVWGRFAQPSALLWAADTTIRRRVERSVAAAIRTAARFAAALGPRRGAALDFWTALFRQTYRAELRVEAPGRETQIIAHAPDRYRALLPLAWAADGIAFDREGDVLAPSIADAQRRRWLGAWRARARWGRPLNVARLAKAAFTFDGAARYGVWKIERHTGVRVQLTPWREKHPVLAGPGVLWTVFRRTSR
ncbi:hypothetical protein [Sphingomonas sp. TZW2008]|uniref:hypothetical protein n=1 Tax=Sphingomonas sp. TZW2008 TaxID=1917973 RepID=UPI000A267323|nr:hypothetical protein [Sphingomonas sp. TZW2008]